MAIKKEFTFPSRDGVSSCHAISWEPDDGNIKAIFQIIHGMNEYIDRYDDFASFMASNGFLVVGDDHLGHGKTASGPNELGYFAKQDPQTVVVRDVHRLKKITQEKHPGIPYFIMGHSMGSFIMRKYLTMYGSGIDGSIVMGTGVMPSIVTGFGVFLCNLQKLFWGDHHRSKFITKAAFGSYQKKISNPRTSNDWLTKDTEIVDKYLNDSFSMFTFTLNGYRTLFKLVSYVCKKKNLTSIPKDLPILVCAGADDPVGNYGKGPKAVYDTYVELGIKSVDFKLYDNDRHEILNETDRKEVYQDILNWVESKM